MLFMSGLTGVNFTGQDSRVSLKLLIVDVCLGVTGCNGTYSTYGPANGAMALYSRISVT